MSRLFSLLLVAGALIAPVGEIPMASAQQAKPPGPPPAAPPSVRPAERTPANPFVPPMPKQPLPEELLQAAKNQDVAGNDDLVYRAVSYVGTINGNDVFRFGHGKCYLEARGGRFVDSQCYRAASRWVRDNPDKR